VMRCMGGEGVGWVVRYLWSHPHSEKGNLVNIRNHFLEREKSGNIEKRKRKTKGKRQDDHTEVC